MSDEFGAITELSGAAALELAASALAERGAKTGKCKNCGAPVLAAYCGVCGQERETHRHSLLHLAHDLVAETSSLDSRVLRTVFALLFKPGELALAFHEGRTRRYMPALRLYLFTSLLFFVLLSYAGIALCQIEWHEQPNAYIVKTLPNGGVMLQSQGKIQPLPMYLPKNVRDKVLSPGPHSGIALDLHLFERIGKYHQHLTPQGWARIAEMRSELLRKTQGGTGFWSQRLRNALTMFDKLAHDPAALNERLNTYIPRMFFVLLPLFALLLAAFYWRSRIRFYFVDHLVFSLGLHTFVFAMLIFAIAAAQVLPGDAVADAALAVTAIYFLASLKRFYRQGWIMTAVKFTTISFIYVFFFLFPALFTVMVFGFIEG